MNRYWHWGQLGDIIYSIPTTQALGEGVLVTSILKPRFEFMRPLLERHFAGVEHDERGRMNFWRYQPPGVTHDLNVFRVGSGQLHIQHLALAHAAPWRVKVDPSVPWLRPDPSWVAGKHQRVVIARSPRYRNPRADWWEHLPADQEIVFVGQPDEWFGVGRHVRVESALEMAQLIYESQAFYGNQSFPLSLAEGLGVQHFIELDGVCTNTVIKGSPKQSILACPTLAGLATASS